MSPHPPHRSPDRVPLFSIRGDRGSWVFKTKQYWNVLAGWLAWADDAASSTGKQGQKDSLGGAVMRKKSSDICRVPGSVSSIQ